MRRRRVEVFLAFVVLPLVVLGVLYVQVGLPEMGTPSCADPCIVMGDRYDTGAEQWLLYLAHCPDPESLAACEQDHPYVVTGAEWKSYRPGMRYAGNVTSR